jgi:2-methylcitrate dehydratase PrpD
VKTFNPRRRELLRTAAGLFAVSALSRRVSAVLRQREKVRLIRDDELEKRMPAREAIVELELTDGTKLTEHITAVRGTPDNPMTRQELIAKAQDLIAPVLGTQTFASSHRKSSRSKRSEMSGSSGRFCGYPESPVGAH